MSVLVALAHPQTARGWWQDYADVLTSEQLDILAIENIASHVMTYDPQYVPDVLRTPDYTRVTTSAQAIAAHPGAPDGPPSSPPRGTRHSSTSGALQSRRLSEKQRSGK